MRGASAAAVRSESAPQVEGAPGDAAHPGPEQRPIPADVYKRQPLWLLQMELRHRSERVSLREPHLSDYATILLKDVIASHAPDLSAVHLVDLDDMRHHHGVFNRETRKAIQRLSLIHI